MPHRPDMAGVIVEGTFTSIENMASDLAWLRIYPLQGLVTQHYDSISKIDSLQTPLLILHGSEDEIVPVAMAKELFAAAPQPKQLVIIPQANHNNLPEFGDKPIGMASQSQYLSTLQQFIETNQRVKK